MNNEPLTEKLFSCYTIKELFNIVVCRFHIHHFSRVNIYSLLRHIDVNFTFGLSDCVSYIKNFVKFRGSVPYVLL